MEPDFRRRFLKQRERPWPGIGVWRGLLQAVDSGWSLVIKDDSKTAKGDQVLAFALEEVREARLVPVVDFKGRRSQKASAEPTGTNGVVGGQER